MIRRLKNRFILAAVLSLLLVLSFMIGVYGYTRYRMLLNEMEQSLHCLADYGGKFPEQWLRIDDERLSVERVLNSKYFTAIFSKDGKLLSIDVSHIDKLDGKEALKLAEEAWEHPKAMDFISTYRFARYTGPAGVMFIFLDAEQSLSAFRSEILTGSVVALLGVIAVTILLLILSGQLLRPVAESVAKQKRFITDAGHELKTPLAAIQANCEVLNMEIGENEWVEDILAQNHRLNRLTQNLIELARLEEQEYDLILAPFNLSELLLETCQDFKSRALQSGQNICEEVEEGLILKGNRDALERAISALLDNALTYSAGEGEILVELKEEGGKIKLDVENTAPAFDFSQIDQIFDRFARGDLSRNSKQQGFGLGLSVVEAVARRHHASLVADEREGKRLRISLTFS